MQLLQTLPNIGTKLVVFFLKTVILLSIEVGIVFNVRLGEDAVIRVIGFLPAILDVRGGVFISFMLGKGADGSMAFLLNLLPDLIFTDNAYLVLIAFPLLFNHQLFLSYFS